MFQTSLECFSRVGVVWMSAGGEFQRVETMTLRVLRGMEGRQVSDLRCIV